MATINIPTPLRKFTDQKRNFETDKHTLSDAIDHLVATYPEVKSNLLDEQGKVRSFIKVYIEDDEVNPNENEAVELNEDTEVSIVPAIAGGKNPLHRGDTEKTTKTTSVNLCAFFVELCGAADTNELKI